MLARPYFLSWKVILLRQMAVAKSGVHRGGVSKREELWSSLSFKTLSLSGEGEVTRESAKAISHRRFGCKMHFKIDWIACQLHHVANGTSHLCASCGNGK